MADLSVTAADVGVTDGSPIVRAVQVGVAVEQGQAGYKDLTNNDKYALADADLSEASAKAECIFLSPASTDGYALAAFKGSSIDVGATLAVGERYYVSGTAGGIAPSGDLATGDYVTLIGIATATDTMKLIFEQTGVQVP